MMHVLVVTSRDPMWDAYSYYQDWLDGFLGHPDIRADVLDVQTRAGLLRGAGLRGRYDAIFFLHNLFVTLHNSPRLTLLRGLLWRVRGPRAFFSSNEFRSFEEKTAMSAYLGARTLVTQLNLDDAQMVYPLQNKQRLLSLPYGFTPSAFAPSCPIAERSIDIGFRGDRYPEYVGHDDRDILLDALAERLTERDDVRADIRVGERLARQAWAAFLNDCRALVGHEAGAAAIDTKQTTRRFLNTQKQRLSPENFRALVLTMREHGVFDPPPSGRIAAPRNFEAMGTQTVQILLPGRYNDVLQPDVHYWELQRDFSNLEAVLERLADDAACQALVQRAYTDALANHTYEQRINQLLASML